MKRKHLYKHRDVCPPLIHADVFIALAITWHYSKGRCPVKMAHITQTAS